ncbi:MAG: 3-dehydroquinate dehydratase [Solirubrobacterales bacterium]|nr:3-dehydroquinate dehydratase [Solirubrobacterales bacterium]
MSTAKNRVAVLHGVNFGVLEKRDPELYGGLSLSELEYRISGWAGEMGLEPIFFQSDSEAEFCGFLHRLDDTADAALLNAGAWTHYSRAIADALAVSGVPTVEVHLSDVDDREEWRKVSVFEGLVVEKIAGRGPEGYRDGLEVVSGLLGTKS